MFKHLLRALFLIGGVAMLLDVALPTKTEQLRIDSHTIDTSRTTDDRGRSQEATSYTLHFVGGSLKSCSVGHAVHTYLKDGEPIKVEFTKLFNTCVRLNDVPTNRFWPIFHLLGGILMLLASIGWGAIDKNFGITFRLGR